MKPKTRHPEQDDLLRPRLVDLIDMRHELVKLEALIDWEFFEREWAGFFPSGRGRPATSPQLVAGLLYLQHAFALSDEAVVARWVENPNYQHALFAVLCACGHNLRKILAHLRAFWALLTATMRGRSGRCRQPHLGQCATPSGLSLQTPLHRLMLELCQHVVGADRVADRLGGDMGVLRRRRQLCMAEQHLDDAHVGVGLEQVRGEAVAERVQRRRLGDAGHVLG